MSARNCDTCGHAEKGAFDELCKDCCAFTHWTNAAQLAAEQAKASSSFKAGVDRLRKAFLETHQAVIDAAILGKAADLFMTWNSSITRKGCPLSDACHSPKQDMPCVNLLMYKAEWIAAAKKQGGIS